MKHVQAWSIWAILFGFLTGIQLPSQLHAKEPVASDKVLEIFQQPADKTQAAKLLRVFDLVSLKQLPQQTFTTHTPWYKKPVTFTGPLLRDVLNASKVKGTTITAVALDEYKAKLPFSDAEKFDLILAHSLDGKQMGPKNKGPLFVVYPYDSRKELQSVLYYQRSVWQLKGLIIE
jgi:hypothetical protein